MSQRHTSRRDFIRQVAGTALAAGTLGEQEAFSAVHPNTRPNVLFIMSDDMRVELGCYGSRFHAQTPNLDALAGAGVRFDRNYCQFPLCNPSRASLLTGQAPLVTKVLGNRTDFRKTRPDATSLPQVFKENGYVTARTGKIFHAGYDDPKGWTIGYANGPTSSPTEPAGRKKIVEQLPVPPAPPDVLPVLPLDNQQALHSDQILVLDGYGEGSAENHVADTAIEYLRTYRNQPFFIGCGFSKPHSPPTAPQRFFDLYDTANIDLTPDFAAWPTVPPGFPKAAIRMRNADLFIGRGASTLEAKEVIRAYLASISWVDWNVGRVLAELDALGLRHNTIIVFVADHGYQLGEKGKWSKAGSLFEMGTRVPLIIHDPRAKGNGQTSVRIVQSLDIYPTLVELCGLKPPAGGLQGSSLVLLLKNPRAQWDRPVFSIWSEDGATVHGTAVRTEQWRYAEFGPAGSNGAMLFDVHADPLEMTNLADHPEHAKTRASLSALIAKHSRT